MSDLQLKISNLDDLAESSKKLLEAFPKSRIFAFRGELGAGKTTFIKALCQQLGVEEVMSSPSFSIINEYRSIGGEVIYHFDLYRLKSIEEALVEVYKRIRPGDLATPESAQSFLEAMFFNYL